jgi:hypothetical protein
LAGYSLEAYNAGPLLGHIFEKLVVIECFKTRSYLVYSGDYFEFSDSTNQGRLVAESGNSQPIK